MPRPTSSTTLQRPELAALAWEYAIEQVIGELIADKVMPIFDTPHQSADYPIIPSEAVAKIPHNIERAPRSNYARDDWEFETGTYACKEKGFEVPVDAVEAKLYARYFDAEVIAAKRAIYILLLSREKRVADYLFNGTTFSGKTSAASVAWDVPSDADILADAKTAKDAVRAATGLKPNAAIMSETVRDAVVNSLQFIDHVKYTRSILLENDEAKNAAVASFLGVPEIIVGKAAYDSAKKGAAFSSSDIWNSTYCLFARIAKNPKDLKEPCIGRTFLWTEESAAGVPGGIITESYEETATRAQIIRARHNIHEVSVFLASGYLLSSVTS